MNLRTRGLCRFFGTYCVLVGIAMLARGHGTVEAVTQLVHDPALMYVLGVALVMGGVAVLVFHNDRSGGPYAVAITLIGWGTLVKGALFLLLPPETEAKLFLEQLDYEGLYRFYAAVSIVIGAILAWGGWRGGSGGKAQDESESGK